MRIFAFCFLLTLGCFINSISAQSDSLITELEKTLQIQIDALGEEHLDIAMYCDSLGEMYLRTGKYAQADGLFTKALDIKLKKLEEKHPDIADSYHYSGNVNYYTGDYQKAISFWGKALNIRLEVFGEKHPDVAKSYNNLGAIYQKTGDYEKAIGFYNRALNIRLELLGEKHPNSAQSYISLGTLYATVGDYEKAINFYDKTLNVWLETLGEKHPHVALCYNNFGNVYMETGDYEKAIILYNKALNIRLEIFGEKHTDIAQSYNNIGMLYDEAGDYEKAVIYYNKALNIRLDVFDEDHPDIAYSYQNLGLAYNNTNDYEKAISFTNKALNMRLGVFGEKHPFVASSYHNLGLIYNNASDYEKAISFTNKALNIRLDVFSEKYPFIASSYNNLATAYKEIGDYKKADSLWHIVIPQNIGRLKSTYLFLPNQQRIKYANTLASMNTDFYSFTAINDTKSTKQLAANHLLNTKSLALDYAIFASQLIKAINDTTLTAQYRQLNKFNKQLADAEKLTSEELKEKDWDLSKIQDKQDNLAFQMLQHPQLKSKLNTETIEWQDVQNHLASDEAMIDFTEVYETQNSLWAYYAVVIRKDFESPQFVRITDENILSKSLKTNESERPYYLADRSSRKALYKALWQPLEPYLKGIKTVHISPAGILHRVPFESLQNEENEYLAGQYEFHYYSAMRDMLKEKPQKMTYKDMVLMGHILYDLDNRDEYEEVAGIHRGGDRTRKGIDPLPATLEEVRRINKIGKKARLKTTLLTIAAPSEDTIQTFVGERAPSIIHFATHGVFLPSLKKKHQELGLTSQDRMSTSDNPLQRSALMLYGANERWTKGRTILGSGEDGILTALEVTALDLQNTDLVVLSACSTGLGNVHNTEGVFGLQRAFKLAGVEYVVASLWDVDDEATKDLMIKFYKNLLQHKQDPTTALRNAKDELREAGYEPENWAGFILIE